MRVGQLDLRRAPPYRLVDPLRAPVRRRQEVPAGRRRWSHPGRLADHQHPEPGERLPRATRTPAPIGPAPAAPIARMWFQARIPTTARTRFSSGSTRRRSCNSRRAPTAMPSGIRSSVRGSSTSICRSSGTSCSAAASRCSSGSRRSIRSTSRSGMIRTQVVSNSQYGQITSTRKPMRELQLGVKFGF